MSLQTETIAQIQAMLEADPAMVKQLQSGANAYSAVALLATAASAKGIAVSTTELTAHLQEAAASQTGMSDTELEAVAGGLSDRGTLALFSVFGVGIVCAIISIRGAVNKTSCASAVND